MFLWEGNKHIIKQLRINEKIRVKEVRLIGEKGEQLGVMPFNEALEAAKKHNLDLVEVAATASPPVCRLLDYGKYRYEQAKKERVVRRSQRVSLLREIRMRPKIGSHDFDAKARSVKKLLGEGDKVKVTMMFSGREIAHTDIGWKLLQRMAELLKEVSSLERPPVMEGKRMSVILSPIAAQKTEATEGVKRVLNAKIKNS